MLGSGDYGWFLTQSFLPGLFVPLAIAAWAGTWFGTGS